MTPDPHSRQADRSKKSRIWIKYDLVERSKGRKGPGFELNLNHDPPGRKVEKGPEFESYMTPDQPGRKVARSKKFSILVEKDLSKSLIKRLKGWEVEQV